MLCGIRVATSDGEQIAEDDDGPEACLLERSCAGVTEDEVRCHYSAYILIPVAAAKLRRCASCQSG
jgi:hypothetical protein